MQRCNAFAVEFHRWRDAGDKSTKNEGKGDQAKSNLKDAGEKVKDAFKK